MKKIVIVILLLLHFGAKAQSNFELRINMEQLDVKNLSLSQALDDKFYEKKLNASSKVDGAYFHFKGDIVYPYLFELMIDSGSYSSPFILYPGTNDIKLVLINGAYEAVRLDSHRSDHNLSFYLNMFPNSYDIYKYLGKERKYFAVDKSFDVKRDSLLSDSYLRTDSAILCYTKDNPNSYFGLWYLARLMKFGYSTLHGDAFENLDASLRFSFLGRQLAQDINLFRKVAIGQTLPNANFQTDKEKPISLKDIIASNDLTLVSFWYSDCGPCIAKFPALKKLYSDFREEGFRIVGISTDKIQDKDKWLNSIDTHRLPWINLIDLENQSRALYQVHVFPFSYLVARSGEIIDINVSEHVLRKILTQKRLSDEKANK